MARKSKIITKIPNDINMRKKPFETIEYLLCTKKRTRKHILWLLKDRRKTNNAKPWHGYEPKDFIDYFGIGDFKNIHKDNVETMTEILHLHRMLKHKAIREEYPALAQHYHLDKDIEFVSGKLRELMERFNKMDSNYSQMFNRIGDLESARIKFSVFKWFSEKLNLLYIEGTILRIIISLSFAYFLIFSLYFMGLLK